jgi:hypothetical protein
MPGIFVLDENRKLHELREQPYETEALLQQLLSDFPDLLAGELVDSEAPRRWLLISPELGLADGDDASNRWAVDHLFLDQDGIPTIVEVKRSTDTRIRREVIGQLLEYAANAVSFWPVEKLQATFEGRCQAAGTDAAQTLQGFLGENTNPSAFWGTVDTNLKAGKIRILLVGDSIPREVRRIVEFLNGQMVSAEILAVEIKQFGNETLKTLVPRVYGQTEQAARVKAPDSGRGARLWDESSVLGDVDARFTEPERDVPRRVLLWAKARSLDLRWGKGPTYGSCHTAYRFKNKRGTSMPLLSLYSTGQVAVPFGDWKRLSFVHVDGKEILASLNAIPGVKFPAAAIEKWPSMRFTELAVGDVLERVLGVVDSVLAECQRQDVP